MKYFLILICFSLATTANARECDFIQFNKCRSCDTPLAFNVGSDEACKFLCPNREVNYAGSGSQETLRNCALKKCPPEFPFSAQNGSCFSSAEEAEKHFYITLENTNNDNILRSSFSTAPSAIKGKCPQDKPLLYSDKCFSCGETDELSVSKEDCDKCPNRIYKHYSQWGVKVCELKPPAGKPLQRWDGRFFSCNEEKAVRVATHCNIEEDCEELCPNRTILYWAGGNVPSVPNCPKEKPLMDSEGICYACNTPVAVGLKYNTRLCEKFCPNERHVEGDSCILN